MSEKYLMDREGLSWERFVEIFLVDIPQALN